LGIVAVGTLARVGFLWRESAWYDEVLSLHYLGSPGLDVFWRTMSATDPSTLLVPVYYTLEYLWAACFGTDLLRVRLLSVLFGLATIPLVAGIGARCFGRAAGLTAAALLALSLPHIFYSQEIRRYALDTFLVAFSVYSLLRAQAGSAPGGWWWAHLGANLLLPWTSLYAAPVLAVQALYLLWQRIPLPRLLLWGAATAFSLLGVVAWTLSVELESLFWMPLAGPREFLNTLVVLAGGRFSNDAPGPYLPDGFSLELPFLVLIYLLAGLGLFEALRRDRASAILLVGWFVAPVLAWYIFQLLWKPCFLYRYFLFCSLPLYVLAGAGLARVPRRARLVALVALLCSLLWQNTVQFYGPFRPDYRHAAEILNTPPGESAPILVLKEPLNTMPLAYTGTIDPARIHPAHGEGSLHDRARELGAQGDPFWIVLWRWDRKPALEDSLDAAGKSYTRYVIGGMPPLELYFVTNRPQFSPSS